MYSQLVEALENENFTPLTHYIIDYLGIEELKLGSEDIGIDLYFDDENQDFVLDITPVDRETDYDINISGTILSDELDVVIIVENNHPDLEFEGEDIKNHFEAGCEVCIVDLNYNLSNIILEDIFEDYAREIVDLFELKLYEIDLVDEISVAVSVDNENHMASLDLEIDFLDLDELNDLEIVQARQSDLVGEWIQKLPNVLKFNQQTVFNDQYDKVSKIWKLESEPLWFLLKHVTGLKRVDKFELYFAWLLYDNIPQQELLKYTKSDIKYQKSAISKYITEIGSMLNDMRVLNT